MQTKSIFESKTALVNLVALLSTFYPPVGSVIAANPEVSIASLALVNVIVRLFTNKRIQLFPG